MAHPEEDRLIDTRTLFTILTLMPLLFFSPLSSSAATSGDKKGELSIGFGRERLTYGEFEPDNDLTSKAKVDNVIVRFEAIRGGQNFFAGMKGVAPVSEGSATESWYLGGLRRQENRLTYGWTRIDAFAGHPVSAGATIYGGIRWSEQRQERRDVVVSGAVQKVSAIERVRSVGLLVGLRGEGRVWPRWRAHYRIEGMIPLALKATNSAVAGFEVTNEKGYAAELLAGVQYLFSPALRLDLSLHAGRMHWEGSGWMPHGSSFVKWPENDTTYRGATAALSYRF